MYILYVERDMKWGRARRKGGEAWKSAVSKEIRDFDKRELEARTAALLYLASHLEGELVRIGGQGDSIKHQVRKTPESQRIQLMAR